MKDILKQYAKPPEETQVQKLLAEISGDYEKLYAVEVLKRIFPLIDLTTLGSADTQAKVETMCRKINDFHTFPRFVGIANVAAICVYPALIPVVKRELNARGVQIASVAGGFPASQTFTEIKVAETRMAISQGATEIDVVLPVGKFLEGKLAMVYEELAMLKKAAGKKHLKVILETGLLKTPKHIKIASVLAMEAGADFIKTSTGKEKPAATPEAAVVMCQAIREYSRLKGRKVGFKAAGGIATAQEAVKYFAIVNHILGKQWLIPELFRIGASRLANQLLAEIQRLSGQSQKQQEDYF